MAEGLSWLLELNAKLDGAIQMGSALKTLEARLKSADDKLKQTKSEADKVSEGFKKVGEFMLGQLGASSIESVVDHMKEFASTAMETAMETKHMDRAWGNFYTDANRAIEFGHLEKMSETMPATSEQLKKMGVGFAEIGMKSQDIERSLKAAFDVQTMSVNTKSAAGVASALQRIFVTGKLARGSLVELGLKPAEALAGLKTKYHGTTDELMKMARAGKIAGEDLIKSIESGVAGKEGGVLGTMGAEASKDLDVQLMKLGDRFKHIFSDALLTVEPQLADLATRLEKINWAKGMEMAATVFRGLLAVAEDTLRVFEDLGLIKHTKQPGEDRGTFLHPNGMSRMEWLLGSGKAGPNLGNVGVHTPFGGMTENAGDTGFRFYEAGRGLGKNAGLGLAAGAKDGGAESTKSHSPSLVFKDIGEVLGRNAGNGLAIGTESSLPAPSSYQKPTLGASSNNLKMDFTINVDGKGDAGEAIVAKLRGEMPGMMQSALRRLSIEAGV